MYNGSRAHAAKRNQWSVFRLLGADGASIPSDDEEAAAEEAGQLGGDQIDN
jgi:hypothetical protein